MNKLTATFSILLLAACSNGGGNGSSVKDDSPAGVGTSNSVTSSPTSTPAAPAATFLVTTPMTCTFTSATVLSYGFSTLSITPKSDGSVVTVQPEEAIAGHTIPGTRSAGDFTYNAAFSWQGSTEYDSSDGSILYIAGSNSLYHDQLNILGQNLGSTDYTLNCPSLN